MLKFCLPPCVRSECVTGTCLPLRLNRKHFAGVIENRSRSFYFGAGPSPVAEGAERRRFFPDPNIAGNEVCLLERDIKLRFVCKLEGENFSFDQRRFLWRAELQRRRARGSSPLRDRHFYQPEKSTDAVLEVHDQIALGQFAEIDLHAMAFRAAQTTACMGREPPEYFASRE